ncbi:hypothetical protein TNCV_4175221, partial [Trichonephila clavipes]
MPCHCIKLRDERLSQPCPAQGVNLGHVVWRYDALTTQPNDFQLYLSDALLLEDESIMVLRENDTVRLEYIEPPNLEQYNSSILNVCASDVSNSKISSKNSTKVNFSKKRKRKEFTSDIITIMGNEEKDSNKKKKHELTIKNLKKHELSFKNSSESNMTEYPFLIQYVNENAEEIINISEEDKMSLHSTKPKDTLEMEEQKKDYVVFDCCEVVKETNSSSQLHQNNSFAKGSRKDLIEVNENNQVKFEKQDEDNKSDNFNADNEVCAVTNTSQLIQGNNCKKKKRKRHRKRKSDLNSSFNNDFIYESHCPDLFTENVEDGALSNIFDVDKNIKNSYEYSPSTKTTKTELSQANNIATNNIYPNPTTPCQQRCTLQVSIQNKVPEALSETYNHSNTFKSISSSTSSRTPSTCNKQKKEVYSHDTCSESLAVNASNCKTVSPITNNSGPPNSLKSIKSPTL